MQGILASLFSVIFSSCLIAQKVEVASLLETGHMTKEVSRMDVSQPNSRMQFSQLLGFPVSRPAHPTFKNFRNVTLADLNSDGIEEILVCMNQTIYCISGDGQILWEVALIGTSNFPPAISDMDNDGDLEVALQTYTIPSDGRVYLLDHNGKVEDGWPIAMNNHFFLNAVILADMDSDGEEEIIACERVSSAEGKIHVLNSDGSSVGAQWPAVVAGTPAFTPSVADLNLDGELELVTCSTTGLYIFDEDAEVTPGFPLVEQGKKFSYQSPLIFQRSIDEEKVILGARHGDFPDYYICDQDGEYVDNWPISEVNWTYATPAIADLDGDGEVEIFYGRPYVSDTDEDAILLGFTENGQALEGFPITGLAGSEGLIAIADVNNDGQYELLTSSKITADGSGFIHAYSVSTGLEADGFPLRVTGFTFLNGAYLGDVDGDGNLDLTALSYQLKFDGNSPDSAFVNVFDLEVPYQEDLILFNGYKGATHHRGEITDLLSSNNEEAISSKFDFHILQNPVLDLLMMTFNKSITQKSIIFSVVNCSGQVCLRGEVVAGEVDVSELNPGIYNLRLEVGNDIATHRFIKL